MSQTTITKKIWQSEPKENLVTSNPVENGLKLENTKPKDPIIKSPPWGRTVLKEFLENTTYPDFRYFCTSCGSLDVYITLHRQSEKVTVYCLDCKKVRITEMSHKGAIVSCLC